VNRAALAAVLFLLVPGIAPGQTSGPYVTGHIGVSGGDGGPALASGGSVGYLLPRSLGFEVEISVSPGLDLGDLGLMRARPAGFPSLFPEPTIAARGRLLTFHTNVIAPLDSAGRLRVVATGGGGVANLHQDILYRFPRVLFPPDLSFLDGNLPPNLPALDFEFVEERISRSENALSLNAGGIVEYAVRRRFGVGVAARYTHAFFSREGLHGARVTAHARWQF
jgi:hypothetical protein